jgi:DNA-binding SARP family transcriptional activator
MFDQSAIHSPPFLLRLLGPAGIEGPEGALSGPVAHRHRLALLALLATAPRGILARDRILGLLWPETDTPSARRLLNNAVHVIRQALGDDVVISEGEGLRLGGTVLRVDVLEFEAAVRNDDARGAVELYTGSFLDGLFLPDAVEFEQWQDRERDRLDRVYHVALERLAETTALERGQAEAVLWWRRRLACTPADGRIVLRLMRALADAGDRAGALQAASAHAVLLREEFGAVADAYVEGLADELRTESVRGNADVSRKARPPIEDAAHAQAVGTASETNSADQRPSPRTERGAIRVRRTPLIIAGLAVVLLSAVYLAALAWRADGGPRPWTIITDVDGTADPSYRLAVRELVRNELDGSTVIRTVPTSDIVDALHRAGRPSIIPITADVARELAVRHSLRTVIDVRLDRIGSTYSLSLRALEAETGHALAVANETARNDDAILAAVANAARDLRRQLGEQRQLLGFGRDPAPPATPSFEAFRKWAAARETWDRRFDRRAHMALLHDALSYDSSFTAAWLVLAEDYSMTDRRDSAVMMLDHARRHSAGSSELERKQVEARYAYLTGNREKTLEIYDELVRRFPEDPEIRFDHSLTLRYQERYDEALEQSQVGSRLSPLGAPPIRIMGQAFTLLGLGRHDEAWEVAQRMGTNTATARIGLGVTAITAARWADVERLAVEFQPELRGQSTLWRAVSRAARGRVTEALDSLLALDSSAIWVAFSGPSRAQVPTRTRIVLSFASRLPLEPLGPLVAADTSLHAQISQGYWAVLAGDTSVTRRTVTRLHSLHPSALIDYGAWPQFLDALISSRRGDWTGVLALAPVARTTMADVSYRFQVDAVLPAVLQWFVAHAYEQTARPDSAAHFYALITSPRVGVSHGNEMPRAAISSLAHQRLVVLYSRLGRLDDARRHWKILGETFTQPDPELVALVAEARQALRHAERATM